MHLDPSNGNVAHRRFTEVVDILHPGDVLVMNDSRVSAWRFLGHKPTGGQVEVLALREVEPSVFECLLKPGKRLKAGSTILLSPTLEAEVLVGGEDGLRMVRLSSSGGLREEMSKAGRIPLPPYIHTHLENSERYQTVIAREEGSAAAPTAGLHFTEEILNQLRAKGVVVEKVTLHVGIDTFRPIQVDDVSQHVMHGEVCEISEETARAINSAQGRVIAVGTTAVRTLESFASPAGRGVLAGKKSTQIFISPGYHFQVIDGMFTNFHLPKTTMMLMISALAGRDAVLNAYKEAVEQKYRFLSFGDSMLILKS